MDVLELVYYLLAICFYLIPISLVINSKRTRGQEKNFWLIVTLFLTWFGWLLYISTAKKHHKPKHNQK
ncbi:hypothetical protein [Algibacillus agarilyticus]|uniref:hypothetical protein n=1 Tax=Algibacillus agarilyticus TaxID=2234133 RepID=UPI000DD06203|nr:hypothetical protein [Algibacillus agarilyticus]